MYKYRSSNWTSSNSTSSYPSGLPDQTSGKQPEKTGKFVRPHAEVDKNRMGNLSSNSSSNLTEERYRDILHYSFFFINNCIFENWAGAIV